MESIPFQSLNITRITILLRIKFHKIMRFYFPFLNFFDSYIIRHWLNVILFFRVTFLNKNVTHKFIT